MRGSEFVQAHARKGLSAWEREALILVAEGKIAQPPVLPVPVRTPDGVHSGTFFAVGDYLAIGEPGDYLRMPLTPRNAQRVADLFSVLLPTSKMVDAIWRAAPVKLSPSSIQPNPYANLASFLAHSRTIDQQLATAGALDASGSPRSPVAGDKKDVVISRHMPAGKVVIYGWHLPEGDERRETYDRDHIQPRSSVHAEGYLDYSHGVRLISPNMVVDGRDVTVAEVLADPVLSSMLSDEGPITKPRYGNPPSPADLTYAEMLARLRALG